MRARSSLLLSALLATAACSALGCVEDATEGDEQFQDSGPALAFDEYTVLFTNPLCKRYPYGPEQNVVSVSGERLEAKPEGAWCSKSDSAASAARPESPQAKLISWIDDPETTEIFFAYFTMSNAAVKDAVCKAIQERDVKVTMVLDQGADLTRAQEVAACAPQSGDPERAPQLHLRGGTGNIALQHNKVFILNPRSERPRIVLSSGNMSSGVVLHHENWHFIAVPAKTFFAQAHLCLIDGLLDHAESKSSYSSFITSCKKAITAKEERDIKTFFTPGEGDEAFQMIQKSAKSAEGIDLAVHRFTHKGLVGQVRSALQRGATVRMVADDDLHWASLGQVVGGNDATDAGRVADLVGAGMSIHFMETNHVEHLLHHNKVLVFDQPGEAPDSVFAGSGNFTGSGFTDNFENFYWVSVPSVVESFRAQYEHLYTDLATEPDNMPAELVVPTGTP